MAMGKNITTQYNEKNKNWENKKDGAEKSSSNAKTKKSAEELGRAQAKKEQLEHKIKNKDGKYSRRNSYGNDPHPPKG
jgi:uncharacterized protein with von Willebrand factor type A (vWA) domain